MSSDSGQAEPAFQRSEVASENAIANEPLATADHDAFARRLGFESYLALFETSTPIRTSTKGKWQMTVLRSGLWAVWNAADLQMVGTFPSEKEAATSVGAIVAPAN
jgi:hypothetical protein